MSYDIGLYHLIKGHKKLAEVEKFTEGGTFVVGGTVDAKLNITYNYSEYFYRHLDEESGIRYLYGKRAEETVDLLRKAVETLGTEQDDNYWEATPGNAGYALAILLKWAIQHLDAIWDGD